MKRLLMVMAMLWLTAAAAFAQDPPVFLEAGGLVVVEVESVPPGTGWELRTVRPGYQGEGYYEYLGPDSFGSPISGSVMTYQIFVTNPGSYEFHLLSQRNATATDIENDSFVRCNGGSWQKHFVYNSGANVWTFNTIWEVAHGGPFQYAKYNLVAGLNTIQIGGRSAKHKLDRFHMFMSSVSNPLNSALPPSEIEGAGSGPSSYTFNFANNQSGFFSGNIAPTITGANAYVTGNGLALDAVGGGEGIVFGYWEKFLTDTTLTAGKTYKVDFTVTTNANNAQRSQVPAFRFRVSDGSFQSTSLMNVESAGDAAVVPAGGEEQTYTMFYTVPDGAEGQTLFVAMDYLFVPGENNPNISVTLKRLTLTRITTP